MQLLIHLTSLQDRDFSYYDKENLETVKREIESGTVPEEVDILNEIPEMGFSQEFTITGHETLLSFPVIKLMEDLIAENSSVNRFFKLESAEDKAACFLDVWKRCLAVVLDKFQMQVISSDDRKYIVYYGDMSVDEIGVLGHEYGRTPHFIIRIPKELVKKYYPASTNYIPELEGEYQQFFDIKKLSEEDMNKYIMPYYYVDLGEEYRRRVRNDSAMRGLLTGFCIESFFAALD